EAGVFWVSGIPGNLVVGGSLGAVVSQVKRRLQGLVDVLHAARVVGVVRGGAPVGIHVVLRSHSSVFGSVVRLEDTDTTAGEEAGSGGDRPACPVTGLRGSGSRESAGPAAEAAASNQEGSEGPGARSSSTPNTATR